MHYCNQLPRRIAFQTLGCKLNQYESESLATQFLQAGYQIVNFDQSADAYIINTCTVTTKADRKSRNVINRARRRAAAVSVGDRGRSSLVVVTGCFAESNRHMLESWDNVYLVGNSQKSQIFHIIDAHFRGEIPSPDRPREDLFDYPPAAPIFHTRSMVKIQDGCDNFCSFCIIPQVRGRATSRPNREVLAEIRTLAGQGAREIVLTGVNLSRYNDGHIGFGALLERILKLSEQCADSKFRLRISSLEPDRLDDRFFALLEHPGMCPHLHLCLQSGSERMLLAMRRQYTAGQYRDIVARIRKRIPDFNFTTDVIVGFPGESDDDFDQTCHLAREVGFGHIHIFKYSRRHGTRADRMPDQTTEEIKTKRSQILHAMSEAGKQRQRHAMLGRKQQLLVERVDSCQDSAQQIGRGYGEHYVPIIYRAPQMRVNGLYNVQLTKIVEGEKEMQMVGMPI